MTAVFLLNPRMAFNCAMNISELMNNIRSWAEIGYKEKKESTFNLYKNDLIIADNTILFKMGEKRAVFLPYNTLNILSTTNEVFCKQADDYLAHLVTKSDRISSSNEKQRNTFFNQIEEKIRLVKKRLH